MSDLPVLIIGAGISGLTLAQYLHRSGVPFLIFERDSSINIRSGGWGLTLHWGLPILRDLLPQEIVARLPECSVNKEASDKGDVGRFPFFDLSSASALFEVPAAERVRVNRGRLRELLTTGVDIQWSKTIVDVTSTEESSVTAHFEDGTSYTGSLLIACDGAHSRVRKLVYPDTCQMNPLPVQLLGVTVPYTPEQAAGARAIDPYIFQGAHPESNVFLFFSFLDTPNNFEDSTDNYLCQIIVSWADSKNIPLPEDSPSRIALMKQLTANWVEPFRSLIQNIPDGLEARSIRIEDWLFNPGKTAHARVLMMGDSAHTMTMFRGEGANNAIADVGDLVKRIDFTSSSSLSSDSLRRSVEQYENDVFTRAGASVLNSRQACLDAHDFQKILNGSPLVAKRVLN
ncbi:FAD-dependent oxidoreductase [Aspergillus clavatus NRRL 1]|uniref:FAD binding domain protein n=1 Tax=Aspergillus clavatus (strain ATCC 1007 / CBS 513.65 / DSM 816 / NCTC 3887 / NRRL 1 / QM 1276 / 107) TaxID=344612 RepID=A1CN28_ASPCL|nr:FAD binding domain protein [Aspergillus clavatus NRRL 1]EAW08965.1 FAD binding domain protein [Aspergillus clavatus NRRL 1]